MYPVGPRSYFIGQLILSAFVGLTWGRYVINGLLTKEFMILKGHAIKKSDRPKLYMLLAVGCSFGVVGMLSAFALSIWGTLATR